MRNGLRSDSLFAARSFLLALAFLAPAASAADPSQTNAQGFDFAKALPGSTCVYFSLPDLDRTETSSANLPWKKLCAEEEVKAFVEKPVAYAKEKGFPALWKEAQKNLGEDLSFLENLRIHSFDVALTSFRIPAQKGMDAGELNALISIGLGEDATRVEALVRKAFLKSNKVKVEEVDVEGSKLVVVTSTKEKGFDKDAPFNAIAWFAYQGRLVIGLNRAPAEMALKALMGKATGATLADDKEFQNAMSKVGGNGADFRFFVKIGEPYTQVMKALQTLFPPAGEGDDAPAFRLFDIAPVIRAIDTLGVGDINSLAIASRANDTHSISQSYLSVAPGARKGLLRLLSSKPVDRALLSKIPKEAQDFSIWGMNVASLWDTIWQAGEAADPEKAKEARAGLAAFETQLGIKIKEDFLDSMGETCIMYSMPVQSLMAATPEMYFLFEAKDREKLERSTISLIKFAAEQSGEFQFKENTFEGGKSYSLSIPGLKSNPMLGNIAPTIAFADKYLIVGLSKAGVKKTVKRLSSGDTGEGAAAIPDFAKFSAKFPKEVTGLSYSDPRPMMTAAYQMMQMFGPMVTANIPGEFPVDFTSLPSTATLTKHFFGGAGYTVATENGWQTTAVSAMGADFLLGVASMAKTMTGVSAGVFLEMKAQRGAKSPRGMNAEEEGEGDETTADPRIPPAPVPVEAPKDPVSAVDLAKQDLLDLKSGVTIFKIETGKYPSSLEELLKTSAELPEGCLPGKKAIPLDPWKNAYIFSLDPQTKSYRLRSRGPNGVDDLGKGDDIVGN